MRDAARSTRNRGVSQRVIRTLELHARNRSGAEASERYAELETIRIELASAARKLGPNEEGEPPGSKLTQS